MIKMTAAMSGVVSLVLLLGERLEQHPAKLQWWWQVLPLALRRRVRRRLPRPVRLWMNKVVKPEQPTAVVVRGKARPAARTGPEQPTAGLLSVVVPIHNVEEYLDECLTSIAAQTYDRLEVILVDDGSTDRSTDIARRFAAADERFHLICQASGGVGAARNAGIALATGGFLAFADSDDVVPVNAYQRMMDSLDTSGSDFTVGNIHRLSAGKRSVPAWAASVHRTDRIGIRLADHSDILQNVFAWNKVFRRTFWDEHIGAFPEGVLYEDQEVSGRAYVQAAAFDVLSTVVYDWRIRGDRSSITQQKDNVRDLSDRLLVSNRMMGFMSETASAEVFDSWLAKVLGPDLALYYVQVPRVGAEYWQTLRTGVAPLAAAADDGVWNRMSVHHRLMVRAIQCGARNDLERIVLSNAETGVCHPLEPAPDGWRAQPGYLDELKMPIDPAWLKVGPESLTMKAELTRVELAAQDLLRIEGTAFIPGIDAGITDPSLVAELVETISDTTIRLDVEHFTDHAIDRRANDAWTSYAQAAFRTDIDLTALRKTALGGPAAGSGTAEPALITSAPGAGAPEWKVQLKLTAGTETLTGGFTHRQLGGPAAGFPLLPVEGDQRFVCGFDTGQGLHFSTVAHRRYVDVVAVHGRSLVLSPVLADGETATALVVDCAAVGVSITGHPVSGPGDGGTASAADPGPASNTSVGSRPVFEVTVPDLPEEVPFTRQHIWKVRVQTTSGAIFHLAWRGDDDGLEQVSSAADALRFRTNPHGYVELHERRWQVVVEDCQTSGESLVVYGKVRFHDSHATRILLPRLALATNREVLRPRRTYWIEGEDRFAVEFELSQHRWDTAAGAPETGLYTLRCRTAADGSLHGAYWVPVVPAMEPDLPLEFRHRYANITVTRTPQAAALAVSFAPPYTADERGKLAQSRMQRSIPALIRNDIEQDAVLFETFGGTAISDSGLGLFNEMTAAGDERPKYWTVRDYSVPVPDGATPVLAYSHQWYRTLHTAEFLVNNNNFPHYYRKNPGQKYIQTWHGTPLKRIGKDVPAAQFSTSYLKLMAREGTYWDYLLAQNNFAAGVLPGALGYSGEVLTLGYPRNDALTGDVAKKRGEAVRAAMGFSDDRKVVLYAPTWRDDVRTASNQYELVNHLDINTAREELGGDYVFLLRGHHNVAAQRSTSCLENIIDVTAYPDINDLYLAADVLVTDYSSVMFDFCVTGKPIYFLAPDLAQYRDKTRGFYVDLEAEAPGPIVESTRELAYAIEAGDFDNAYLERYEDFQDKYAGMDDGEAAARVYEHIWALGARHG
ncbi:bifunctional glycosyltransferase/CDP-glycerol:glycerophosphate glycerophosphotransferase [Arthrobacter pigmenti]